MIGDRLPEDATPVKILVVVGTRPEAIKLVPMILALKESEYFIPQVVSTGQHQDMGAIVLGQPRQRQGDGRRRHEAAKGCSKAESTARSHQLDGGDASTGGHRRSTQHCICPENQGQDGRDKTGDAEILVALTLAPHDGACGRRDRDKTGREDQPVATQRQRTEYATQQANQ